MITQTACSGQHLLFFW